MALQLSNYEFSKEISTSQHDFVANLHFVNCHIKGQLKAGFKPAIRQGQGYLTENQGNNKKTCLIFHGILKGTLETKTNRVSISGLKFALGVQLQFQSCHVGNWEFVRCKGR